MRSTLIRTAIVILAFILFNPASAYGWHAAGHMTVALIAYQQLDEPSQQKVFEILKDHPHYRTFLAADAPADGTLDEWVVMRAAIWPDWIKSPRSVPRKEDRDQITKDFSHGVWHYVNRPIVDTNGADDETQETIRANSKKDHGDILKVFPQLAAGVKDPAGGGLAGLVLSPKSKSKLSDAQARAIALCWVLHLVGDIHQPLHAAAFFSQDSIAGDAGGNALYVRWKNGTQNLHAIWDGAFGWDDLDGPRGPKYSVVAGMARDLSTRLKPKPAAREVKAIDKWADESFQLANDKAYYVHKQLLPGKFIERGEPRPSAADLDPLPDGYDTVVKSIAEQRVALAGYRLADLISVTLGR